MNKICTGCGSTKPLEDFSPSKLGRNGRAPACKICNNSNARSRRGALRMAGGNERSPADRQCGACHEMKTASEFNRDRAQPSGLQWSCRACQRTGYESRRGGPVHSERECSQCHAVKSAPEFYTNPNMAGGLSSACRECIRSPAERIKLRCAKYGITAERFARMLVAQNFLCPVCTHPLGDPSRYHVDHDHTCCPGKKSCGACVRGILHNRCNQALGLLREDAATLRRAADYLDRA